MVAPKVSVLALAALVSSAALPQQSQFKTGVDLVTVDVRAVDGTGNPVADLRPEDFAITVDGRPRRTASMQLVSYSEKLQPAVATAAAPAGENPVTPTAPAGRTVYLVIDESNIASGMAKPAAEAAQSFVDRLSPADRVGLVTIPFSAVRLDATTDRAGVKQALKRITGHMNQVATPLAQERSVSVSEAFARGTDKRTWGNVLARECVEKKGGMLPLEPWQPKSTPREPAIDCTSEVEQLARAIVADVRERMLTSARSLSNLLQAMVKEKGPKTIILVSQELPVPSTPEERKDFQREAQEIATAAARAQADVYVLHLDVKPFNVENRTQLATTGADADLRSYGLETVATVTGGRRLMVSGRATVAFDRIARETSAWYVLGFEADASDRDGKVHAVSVTTTRPGVEIRARRQFAFEPRAQ